MRWFAYHTGVFPLVICLFLTIARNASAGIPDTPYRLIPARETAIVLTGSALFIAGNQAISDATPPGSRLFRRSDVPGFDHIALGLHSNAAGDVSEFTGAICTALPLAFAASAFKPDGHTPYRDAVVILAMYVESNILAQGMTSLAKGTCHRIRPYAYDPNVSPSTLMERDTTLSFWSRHTVTAFNGAVFAGTVFQAYHPDSRFVKPVWAFGLATATATGVLRVRAGQHFPSDVIAGAVAGSLTGWLVPRLHQTCAGNSPSVEVTPAMNGTAGITVHRLF